MLIHKPTKKTISLVCIDSVYGNPSVNALYYSLKQFSFDQIKFLTSMEHVLPKSTAKKLKIEVVRIDPITSMQAYDHFCIKKLHQYIETDFFLIVQHDGFVINPALWTDEFFNYDYIGAISSGDRSVLNGGFSLRSRKLTEALQTHSVNSFTPEDGVITRRYRGLLERDHGIIFPPPHIANRFSHEFERRDSFGFHRFNVHNYQKMMFNRFGSWTTKISIL